MSFVVIKKRNILYFLIMLMVVCSLSINMTGGGSAASVYLGYVPRLVPIYYVQTDKKQVAISFDSAWGADKTLNILENLREYGVGATFFLVGFWVEKYPEMVKKIDEFGIEIGTHSNTHPDLTRLGTKDVELELSVSVDKIKQLIDKDVKLFRPPFGAYNNTLLQVASGLGLTTIQWDVDTLDWKGLSAIEICNRVLNKVKNGSIILCHNNADHIVEALPLILDRLKLGGYSVTSVGDLILKDNYSIDHTGMQKQNR